MGFCLLRPVMFPPPGAEQRDPRFPPFGRTERDQVALSCRPVAPAGHNCSPQVVLARAVRRTVGGRCPRAGRLRCRASLPRDRLTPIRCRRRRSGLRLLFPARPLWPRWNWPDPTRIGARFMLPQREALLQGPEENTRLGPSTWNRRKLENE